MKKFGLIFGPILFVILLFIPAPEIMSDAAWRVVNIALFMIFWWITEAVPIPVTALLPMVLLPLFGISDMKEATAPYSNPLVYLFLGGFMIALAMERWNLHRRIALNIINLTGTNANGIILGIMLATTSLSMFISNTATTVMMLPIALSIIDLLTQNRGKYSAKGIRNFSLSMMLCIAYGANIGGTATIIGTPPTVFMVGFMKNTYDYEVSFASWLPMGLPFVLILFTLTYLFIVRVLYPNQLGDFEGAKQIIQGEIQKLGKISKAEKRVLFVFISTALLWILRQPINYGLELLDPNLGLSDPLIAMMAATVLFVIPVNFKEDQYLLAWRDTEKLPWGILLLFGGGLSLANALSSTGIVDLIGQQFSGFNNASFVLILGLTAVSLFLTEIMSNLALVTVFLPVIGGIATAAGISPLEICIPVTLAASCAFMLPMSTPPNAIVFASGYLKVSEMVRAGLLLNIIAIVVIALFATYLVPYIFG